MPDFRSFNHDDRRRISLDMFQRFIMGATRKTSEVLMHVRPLLSSVANDREKIAKKAQGL